MTGLLSAACDGDGSFAASCDSALRLVPSNHRDYSYRMQRFALFLAAVAAFALCSNSASAQIKTLVSGKNWSAYSLAEKNNTTCYLVGHPSKAVPSGNPRKSVDAMVSHRVAEKAFYVITFNLG